MKPADKNAIHSSVEPYYRTGYALYSALDKEFEFIVDCAADQRSAKCPIYFGPDHTHPELRDALDSRHWG